MLGHVDHGKSTLLGRMLYETGNLPEGKLEQIRAVSQRRGLELEWAFALDALQAERNQGITIDAAHVWMRVGGRQYAFIDAPGHEEFIRNMVSGASSADAALLLIDATEGVSEQSHSHAYLLRLLGVGRVAVVVNKMDAVAWSRDVYERIRDEFTGYLHGLGFETVEVVPISARGGDGVRAASERMPWYEGPSVLEVIERFEPRRPPAHAPLRFPLQDVYKFDERRLLAGRVESGVLRVGDELVFSPWNKTGFVKSIERWNAPDRPYAVAGESVAITLEQQIFVERGQIASHVDDAPVETDVFDAQVFWLRPEPLRPGQEYTLRLTTQQVPCRIVRIREVIDVATLERRQASEIGRHQVAEVTIRTRHPIAVDDYSELPATGRFVLVHEGINAGGGVIQVGNYPDLRPQLSGLKSTHIYRTHGRVSREERFERVGYHGRVIWFTGLSGAGKSTVSIALERRLFDLGYMTYRLDGDNVRHGLSADLGFSAEDRREHIRRVGEVAKLFCDAGVIVLVALISPYAEDRERVRRTLREGEFIEVYTACPLEVCEERDVKGLYAAAREGRIRGFTGIDAPYEPPTDPEITIHTDREPVEHCVERILDHIRALDAAARR
ncbi:MAG: adenylyl-sulfate kinase [Planctomycetota bacterium]|nr:MAG: adenylyl-sulfate kinase [Planctomycetota bacterium]